jgi:hypothetical protein
MANKGLTYITYVLVVTVRAIILKSLLLYTVYNNVKFSISNAHTLCFENATVPHFSLRKIMRQILMAVTVKRIVTTCSLVSSSTRLHGVKS